MLKAIFKKPRTIGKVAFAALLATVGLRFLVSLLV